MDLNALLATLTAAGNTKLATTQALLAAQNADTAASTAFTVAIMGGVPAEIAAAGGAKLGTNLALTQAEGADAAASTAFFAAQMAFSNAVASLLPGVTPPGGQRKAV